MTAPLHPRDAARRTAGAVAELGDRLRMSAACLAAAEAEIVRLRGLIVQAETCLGEALDDLAGDLPAMVEHDTGLPIDYALPSAEAAFDDLRTVLADVLGLAVDQRPAHLQPPARAPDAAMTMGEGCLGSFPGPRGGARPPQPGKTVAGPS